MAKKIEITVVVVPVTGKSTTKKVKFAASGASVGEALKQAGVDPNQKTIRVGGKEVDLDHHIGPNAQIEARDSVPAEALDPAATTVRVSERPQGS